MKLNTCWTKSILTAVLLLFPMGSYATIPQPERRRDLKHSCPEETIQAQHTVLLDVIGRPAQATASEIQILQSAFQTAYDQLAITCSTSSGTLRSIQSVEILPQAVDAFGDTPNLPGSGTVTREFTYVLDIQSVCRGCTDDEFDLFRNDSRRLHKATNLIRKSSMEKSQLKRQRQRVKQGRRRRRRQLMRQRAPAPAPTASSCDCEPPTIQDFIVALNQAFVVSYVDEVVGVAELGVALEVCDDTTLNFDSTILVDVIGNSDAATLEQMQVVEQSILETYNDMNVLGRGDNCDPLSRIVVDGVTLSIVPGSTPASFSIRASVPGICRGCEPDADLFQLSDEPTLVPTPLPVMMPTPAPTRESKASKSASDEEEDLRYRRRLEETISLDCKCSEGAERRAPTEAEFLTALNTTVQVLREEGLLDFIVAVGSVSEINEVPCSTELNTFTTSVPVDYIISVAGITDNDESALESAFLTSYNALTQTFCDPFFRKVVRAELSGLLRQEGSSEERRHLQLDTLEPSSAPTILSNSPTTFPTFFRAEFPFFKNGGTVHVQGVCRGCESNSNLSDDVDDTSSTRQRSLQDLLEFRRLEDTDETCFCSADIPQDRRRAPTLDEIQFAYNRSVAALDLDNVPEVETVYPEVPTPDGVFEPTSAPTFEDEMEPSPPPTFGEGTEPSPPPTLGSGGTEPSPPPTVGEETEEPSPQSPPPTLGEGPEPSPPPTRLISFSGDSDTTEPSPPPTFDEGTAPSPPPTRLISFSGDSDTLLPTTPFETVIPTTLAPGLPTLSPSIPGTTPNPTISPSVSPSVPTAPAPTPPPFISNDP